MLPFEFVIAGRPVSQQTPQRDPQCAWMEEFTAEIIDAPALDLEM
jgi:hypothetical protein